MHAQKTTTIWDKRLTVKCAAQQVKRFTNVERVSVSCLFCHHTLKKMYSRFQPLSPNLKQVQQSFEQVLVNLNDGNQFLMSKCSNCGFINRNNMNTKHAHW